MTPIITKPLSRAEAATIFAENAAFLGNGDAIAVHRMVELFGEPAARFIEENICMNGWLKGGTDYNASGSCAPDDPCLDYFYFTGFLKVVSNHNHRLQVAAHIHSEGGGIWDAVWGERCARIAAQDAKDSAAESQEKHRNRQYKK